MFKTALLAAAALLSVGTAQAEDLRPNAGSTVEIATASGSVYYTKEAGGFRVVATLSSAEGATPIRFIATLADGQAVTVSVPVEGEDAQELEISRDGETLSVSPVETLMVRASLD